MAKYAVLKQERDDAIARAVEAERLSMKEEVDRVTHEFRVREAELQAEVLQLKIKIANQKAECRALADKLLFLAS